MERLGTQQPAGSTGSTLRKWAFFFLLAGVVGRGVLQTHLLGIGSITAEELMQAMSASGDVMIMVTASLVLQAMETCAVPMFAMLLVEGFRHTSDFPAYLLRVFGTAVLCELPYNLAMGGSWLVFESRNPMFGLVLALIAMWLYQHFGEKTWTHRVLRGAIAVAGVLWAEMLHIEFGTAMVVVTGTLWAFRSKPMFRNYAGMAAAMLCSITSLFFLASPMGFLAVHYYNGEPGEQNRLGNYLFYPVVLLAVGIGCKYLIGL